MMAVPFTTEHFLNVFKLYNTAVWPLQLFFYGSAFLAIFLSLKKNPAADKIISFILAFFWLWMGAVYHLIYFSAINKAAYLFGLAFIIQGQIFLYTGILKNLLSFKFQANIYGITGSILITYAVIVYPVLSYFTGHIYPTTPTFGLPCPTTIFTFGILLFADKRIPPTVLAIPLLWSFIGFTAALTLGISEDTGLLIAGLLSTVLIAGKNKILKDTKKFPKKTSREALKNTYHG